MEKKKEHRKKEWQKPGYKNLKFNQTYGGPFLGEAEVGYSHAPES